MHISTTALSVILLSFLGGSQTAHAMEYEDGYGETKFGFQCENRVYTKPVVFAAAKHLCDRIPRLSYVKDPIYSIDGYRGTHGYNMMINMRASELLKVLYTLTPIFADGKLFAFESDVPKKSPVRKGWMDPGPDRLVIDNRCNIMGAFTDQDYTIDTDTARVKACTVLNSKEDIRPFEQSPGRSPQRSREQSPGGFSQQSRDQSPERPLERFSQQFRDQSPGRSREQSPERSQQRSREQSPERSPQRSREQSPERSPQRSREQSSERPLERFSQQSREQSPE